MRKSVAAILLTAFLAAFCCACNAVTPGPATTRSQAAPISVETTEEQAENLSETKAAGDSMAENDAEETSAEESTEEETKAEDQGDEEEHQDSEQQEELGAADGTVYATTAVNVRDAAGRDSNVIGTLYEGQAVTKYGEEGGWTIIEYEGRRAYVGSSYLSETAP